MMSVSDETAKCGLFHEYQALIEDRALAVRTRAAERGAEQRGRVCGGRELARATCTVRRGVRDAGGGGLAAAAQRVQGREATLVGAL
jgi:hypothetical protein